MKTFKDSTTSIKEQEGQPCLMYSDLIKTCLNNIPPQKGSNISLLRERMAAMNAVEKSVDGIINFEDAEFKTVKEAVENFTWGMLHKDIIAFCDYVNSIK